MPSGTNKSRHPPQCPHINSRSRMNASWQDLFSANGYLRVKPWGNPSRSASYALGNGPDATQSRALLGGITSNPRVLSPDHSSPAAPQAHASLRPTTQQNPERLARDSISKPRMICQVLLSQSTSSCQRRAITIPRGPTRVIAQGLR
jgi:hypothetical protein